MYSPWLGSRSTEGQCIIDWPWHMIHMTIANILDYRSLPIKCISNPFPSWFSIKIQIGLEFHLAINHYCTAIVMNLLCITQHLCFHSMCKTLSPVDDKEINHNRMKLPSNQNRESKNIGEISVRSTIDRNWNNLLNSLVPTICSCYLKLVIINTYQG